MSEINYADNDRKINENPTDRQAYRLGHTHAAYGWAKTPPFWGNSKHLHALYNKGYDDYKNDRWDPPAVD